MPQKKVLITGVSGIVGSSAYLQLRRSPEKYDLYGLGRRRVLSARVADARDIDLPEEKHFVCDIADFAAVRRAVEGMDVVDAIKLGTGQNGAVIGAPDKIETATIRE